MTSRLLRFITGSVLALAVSAAYGANEAVDAVVRFDITGFDVAGNTLLAPAAVQAAVAPFAGKDRDFGHVQRALEALEAVYHARGYTMVQVELPEQELSHGVVHFKVVQTKIGRVSVTNNKFFDEANIRRSLPPLVEGHSPNLPAISAAIKLANDNPAKKLTMKLQSGELDDEVNAVLDVADERLWKATLNVDNTGTDSTGKTHVGVVLQHANLFGRDHVGSVQYTTTVEKPSQVSVYGAGYHIPLFERGDSIDLFGSYSNVDSGTVAAGTVNLAISGKGATYGARYNQALAKRGNFEPKLVYGIDYKLFKNYVLFAGQNFGKDVTVHPLSVNYLGLWTMAAGEANVSVTYLRNIPGGTRGSDADFTLARSGAPAAYHVLRFAGTISGSLKNDWQVRAIVNGQYTPDALIPGEQFGAGGASSVRGFNEREVSNDSGVAANVELYTPSLCPSKASWQCRLLAFYDGAYATRNKALAGEIGSSTIGSVGAGLRFAIGTSASVQADFGHVVKAGATGSADKNKVHIRVGLSY